MHKIDRKHVVCNDLPLWRSAIEREYRALPYPVRKLMRKYGLKADEALRIVEQIGWCVDV